MIQITLASLVGVGVGVGVGGSKGLTPCDSCTDPMYAAEYVEVS